MLKKFFAEFVGTFFLVFAGTGSIIVNDEANGVVGLLGISLVFGSIVAVMIYALNNVSGSHLNPAVTIGLSLHGEFPLREIPAYLVAQTGGAFAASALLKAFFPLNKMLGSSVPYDNNWVTGFGMEFILTFLLMFVILRLLDNHELRAFAGIIIGGVICLTSLFGGPISGSNMNPVRSIAPSVLSGNLSFLWVYITATIAGAIAASMVHLIMFKQKIKNPA
jgi:aquaporin NIP